MVTAGDRLRQFIESQGLTLRQFCLNNDIPYNNFIQNISKTDGLGMTLLKRIMEIYPEMDVNWLLKGDVYTIKKEYNIVNEPPLSTFEYPDIFVDAVLKCLDRESVQQKIRDILNL